MRELTEGFPGSKSNLDEKIPNKGRQHLFLPTLMPVTRAASKAANDVAMSQVPADETTPGEQWPVHYLSHKHWR